MEKKLLVLYVGGTIGMRASAKGWVPEPGYLEAEMNNIPAFHKPIMPKYRIRELPQVLDSSNMSPVHWMEIAKIIQQEYQKYHGFIILHGTDTMAYTAAALSFYLEGLSKPVILTGSQIPISEPRNDAVENVVSAMLFATNFKVREVCIYFHSVLLRGNRARKIDSNALRAFDSPNLPPLGTGGVYQEIHSDLLLDRPKSTKLVVQAHRRVEVGVIWFLPGLTGTAFETMLSHPFEAVVFMAFGTGNGPSQNEHFLRAVQQAVDRGVVIVDCSQCYKGMVSIFDYETGNALEDAGVISGYDLTPEAAIAKLTHLLGIGLEPKTVQKLMKKSLVGEMTLPNKNRKYL